MKKFVIGSFLLGLNVQFFTFSSYQDSKHKSFYNNREFSFSSQRLKTAKSENGSKILTVAQQQVRKFINQQDNYKKN